VLNNQKRLSIGTRFYQLLAELEIVFSLLLCKKKEAGKNNRKKRGKAALQLGKNHSQNSISINSNLFYHILLVALELLP
jgi:hypothetical protein